MTPQPFEVMNVTDAPGASDHVPAQDMTHASMDAAMAIKHDVRLDNLSTQILLAAFIVAGVFNRWGYEAVISSGSEGHHSRKSLHPRGNALDWRTSAIGVPDDHSKAMADEVRQRLGPHYDVLWKTTHIHVEFDPEPPASEDYPSRSVHQRGTVTA